ncbi:hypothetical protein SDC9_185847 [bioreactor metagenome]|uniref:Uncharacterized protein n=1 Tax=bioreactor metagenome TaxID=1076179 RepID=A0A645HSF9_9ZZZZ
MLNQRAVGRCFAPEGVGKAAGRTEHLYRNVVAFPFRRTNFRRVQVVRVTSVIEDQTVGFIRRQAQPTTDNLLVKAN